MMYNKVQERKQMRGGNGKNYKSVAKFCVFKLGLFVRKWKKEKK